MSDKQNSMVHSSQHRFSPLSENAGKWKIRLFHHTHQNLIAIPLIKHAAVIETNTLF